MRAPAALVSRFGPDADPDRLDLWRAYLMILRDHVTVSGAFPDTFDEIINDVFGDLLERAQDDAA